MPSLSKFATTAGIVLDDPGSQGDTAEVVALQSSRDVLVIGKQPQSGFIMTFLKQSTLAHVLIVGTYLTWGLLLNAVQGIAYCLIRPFNGRLYRKLNDYLVYAHWNPITNMAFYWSDSQCNVWCQDEETAKSFGKEHGLMLMNHTYEVDFLYCWMLFDMLGMLGRSKAIVKKMLAYVPVVGWNCVFSDQVFLDRNWEKDRETLPGKLDRLLEYEETFILTMFCEGTRFTPTKHEASLKFAQERNLPILKHHLLPRPKGFILCARHFQDKMTYLYDIEMCMPKNQPNKISITSVLKGKPIIADMYVRRFAFKDIPRDDEGLTKFLYKVYQEKDAIMEYYQTHNNTFPEGCVKMPLGKAGHHIPLYLSILGGFAGSLIYWAANAFWFAPSVPQMVAVTSVVGTLYAAMSYLVGLTDSKKGSEYGATVAKSNGRTEDVKGSSTKKVD